MDHRETPRGFLLRLDRGEDLKIKLETMNEGTSVAFQLNGRKFGSLGKGDEVVIDKARNVTVNGEKRPPQESPPK